MAEGTDLGTPRPSRYISPNTCTDWKLPNLLAATEYSATALLSSLTVPRPFCRQCAALKRLSASDSYDAAIKKYWKALVLFWGTDWP
eukprot:CAMPEP_0173275160 /NCGR_PEP_ID=MMETSP1143-20121109/2831_1 /TAXON_ID=483371 /ORGANISM="non described non described, Strain CCMP2298" /LENGTH=86 /DNA_ID=CAMNT_0014212031 /DNA_START=241 /DNA_END=501 /DNA_ORIENTATION=+